MDKLFSDYTARNRDNIINKALTDIENNNTSEVSNSFICLDLQKYAGFNDSQILRMIKLVKNKHPKTVYFLETLLYTENDFTEDFFIESFRKTAPNLEVKDFYLLYFAKYNKIKYSDDIIEYIIQSKNLIGILDTIGGQSYSFVNQLLNNENLVNGINEKSLYEYVEYVLAHFKDFAVSIGLTNSKLHEKYLELHDYIVKGGLNSSHLPRKKTTD